MKKCKPVTQINQLVGGQMYIHVYCSGATFDISYEKMYGRPFLVIRSYLQPTLFLKYRNTFSENLEFMNNHSLMDVDIPAGQQRYNESRLFRFTGHNDRLLKKIVAENDHKAYRELINLS